MNQSCRRQYQENIVWYAYEFFILRMKCNVDIDPQILHSKFTSFDNHTIVWMQYVKDVRDNYVKKAGKEKAGQH